MRHNTKKATKPKITIPKLKRVVNRTTRLAQQQPHQTLPRIVPGLQRQLIHLEGSEDDQEEETVTLPPHPYLLHDPRLWSRYELNNVAQSLKKYAFCEL